MVLLLADTLGVPRRERNALLLSAGFAPMFRESALDDRELAPVRTAIDAILKQQEPYPAVVMNPRWDIVATNEAATRFFGMLLDGRTPHGAGNILRLMFHPDAGGPRLNGRRWRRRSCAVCTGKRLAPRSTTPGGSSCPKCMTSRRPERLRTPGSRHAARARRAGELRASPDKPFNFFSAVTVLGDGAGHHASRIARRVLLPDGRSNRRRCSDAIRCS